jgi:hypothetical protein
MVSRSPFKLVTVADTGITSEPPSLSSAVVADEFEPSVELVSDELLPQPTAMVATMETHKSRLINLFFIKVLLKKV